MDGITLWQDIFVYFDRFMEMMDERENIIKMCKLTSLYYMGSISLNNLKF